MVALTTPEDFKAGLIVYAKSYRKELRDMITIYELSVQWQRFLYFIQQETPDYLGVNENSTGDPRQMTPLGVKDGRMWVIAQKLD